MRRCSECGRWVWPWQRRPDDGWRLFHPACWEFHWDEFFRHLPPAELAELGGTTFWELVLIAPDRWSKALMAAHDAAFNRTIERLTGAG